MLINTVTIRFLLLLMTIANDLLLMLIHTATIKFILLLMKIANDILLMLLNTVTIKLLLNVTKYSTRRTQRDYTGEATAGVRASA